MWKKNQLINKMIEQLQQQQQRSFSKLKNIQNVLPSHPHPILSTDFLPTCHKLLLPFRRARKKWGFHLVLDVAWVHRMGHVMVWLRHHKIMLSTGCSTKRTRAARYELFMISIWRRRHTQKGIAKQCQCSST